MATTQKCLDRVGSFTVILTFVQSSNNKAVGIAQNHCSGNSITGNTASSNGEEGITADNQSNGGQVCMHMLEGESSSQRGSHVPTVSKVHFYMRLTA